MTPGNIRNTPLLIDRNRDVADDGLAVTRLAKSRVVIESCRDAFVSTGEEQE